MRFVKKPYKEIHFVLLSGTISSCWLLIYYVSNLHLAYKSLVIPILLIIAFFSFAWPVFKFKKHYIEYYYGTRKTQTNKELLELFGVSNNNNEEATIELLSEIAIIFNIPVGKLQPTDRFGVELGGFYAFVNPEIEDMERLIHQKTSKKTIPNIMTLKEMIDYIIVG